MLMLAQVECSCHLVLLQGGGTPTGSSGFPLPRACRCKANGSAVRWTEMPCPALRNKYSSFLSTIWAGLTWPRTSGIKTSAGCRLAVSAWATQTCPSRARESADADRRPEASPKERASGLPRLAAADSDGTLGARHAWPWRTRFGIGACFLVRPERIRRSGGNDPARMPSPSPLAYARGSDIE